MPLINPDKVGQGIAKFLTIAFLSLAIVIFVLIAINK